MVKDGMLIEIETKAKNLLKHLPCRQLRVLGVSEVVSETAPNVFGICIKYSIFGKEETFISLFKKADLKKDIVKRCLNGFRNKIPEDYSTLTIKNVVDISNTFLNRFSLKNEIDEFVISKIPYRQLKICFGDSSFFLDIQRVSYQKILAVLNEKSDWPAELNFEELQGLLKRKEIVTLCIQLANFEK